MRPASPTTIRRDRARRGVTLVEMLVVVALVVLMMTILASIFQAATGAISSSRTIQELDNNLRLLDMTIRQDLAGVTAHMTPPLDPGQNLGYFEYGENAPADAQGEDTDDYIAFTTKAPEGQFFSGRIWVPATIKSVNPTALPTLITSQFAEVIYFLRNGNLYRRVLLIVPERKGKLAISGPGLGANPGLFKPAMFGLANTSWMGVNDISAHMSTESALSASFNMPTPNTLGHLTNRENRFAKPRFANDFYNTASGARQRDGIADDGNGDGIPDYYPTLTYTQINIAAANNPGLPTGLINEDSGSMPGAVGGTSYARVAASTDVFAFPFVNCWMYSVAEPSSVGTARGWLHAVNPTTTAGVALGANALILNHAPLEFGDSLPVPTAAGQTQTWWGPPTWRETASFNWRDPVFGLSAASTTNTNVQQAAGLQYPSMTTQPTASANVARNMLPPLGNGVTPVVGLPTVTLGAPFASDGAGSLAFQTGIQIWEDDLIMVGVRSFDVKALDPAAAIYNSPPTIVYNAGYYDLGYASTDYLNLSGGTNTTLLDGTPIAIQDGNGNPQGMGHDGRMPPKVADFRVNPQRPLIKNNAGGLQSNNVGDDNVNLPRLRRVWDSWSTDYTNAPAVDVNLRGSPTAPFPLDRPMYPSYPPPYPQPLRGIQIQIRVVNPKNDKVKVLTIRQDFSDKL